jgi:flavin-dependent dehydrogenase
MMEVFDVIIVGGGPAGLICAETLGKSDKRVLLLEKEANFGDKLCAGGLFIELILLLMNSRYIRTRVSKAFS